MRFFGTLYKMMNWFEQPLCDKLCLGDDIGPSIETLQYLVLCLSACYLTDIMKLPCTV